METAPTAETVETPSHDENNSIIRNMRQAVAAADNARRAAEEQAKELAARLKEREDAELSEMERLKREADELRPLRDAHGKFASKMESLYADELAAVPEDKRPAVEALSGKGDWADRLDALRAAKALLPDPKPMPQAMGSVVAPTAKPAFNSQNIDPRNPPKLGDVLKR